MQTKVVVMTFFAMMVRYPDVALKAQREIDLIIGSDPERLPTLEDRQSLPYLECVLKEVYRYVAAESSHEVWLIDATRI